MNNSDLVYEGILRDRANDIKLNIKKIEGDLKSTKYATRRAEIELISLKKELEKISEEMEALESLQKEDKYYSDNAVVEAFDKISEISSNQSQKINEDIKKLQELKESVQSLPLKWRIDKKIELRKKILAKLDKGQTIINADQRSIIMSRTKINVIKDKMLFRQEARVQYWENKIHDAEVLKESLNPEENNIDFVLDKVYEFGGTFLYPIFLQRQQEVLNEMKEKKVNVVGANIIVMARRTKNHFKNVVDFSKRELERMLAENQEQHGNSDINAHNL